MMKRKETSLLVESWRSFINEGEDQESKFSDTPDVIIDKIIKEKGDKFNNLSSYKFHSTIHIDNWEKHDGNRAMEQLKDGEFAENRGSSQGEYDGLYFKSAGKTGFIRYNKLDVAYMNRKNRQEGDEERAPMNLVVKELKKAGFTYRSGLS